MEAGIALTKKSLCHDGFAALTRKNGCHLFHLYCVLDARLTWDNVKAGGMIDALAWMRPFPYDVEAMGTLDFAATLAARDLLADATDGFAVRATGVEPL